MEYTASYLSPLKWISYISLHLFFLQYHLKKIVRLYHIFDVRIKKCSKHLFHFVIVINMTKLSSFAIMEAESVSCFVSNLLTLSLLLFHIKFTLRKRQRFYPQTLNIRILCVSLSCSLLLSQLGPRFSHFLFLIPHFFQLSQLQGF